MRSALAHLWRLDGTTERTAYACWAAILMGVKLNLDRALTVLVFHDNWSVFEYVRRPLPALAELTDATRRFEVAALLAVSLPFLWAGVTLSVRRLRSLQWPLWLAVLFVVPLAKWFFFLCLLVVPGRAERDGQAQAGTIRRLLGMILPRSPAGSAAAGAAISVLVGLIATALSATWFQEYGASLFVGAPFAMGFLSVLAYGFHEQRTAGQCLLVSLTSVLLGGVALFVLAFEGLICLVMAAPLAAALALMGGYLAYFIHRLAQRDQTASLFCAAFVAVPALICVDQLDGRHPALIEVTTTVEVAAPPPVVWGHVIAFSELDEPAEWLFRLGIAYPKRAEILGTGVGAVRHCVFSTGAFIEPIKVWDEPRLLRFDVTGNPPPMQEWTPYRHIHPPHLDGFLVSREGQFRLVELPNGGTRLEGTTWYQHDLWPQTYWKLWSDLIIHQIHRRVLHHIKVQSESLVQFAGESR